jgi:hypothetical protein
MRFSGIFVAVLFGLTFVSSASAQDDCSDDGVVLYGQPTEVVVIGPEVAEIQLLTVAESTEFELVVTCRGGYLLHASREGRTLSYSRSGCYHIFLPRPVRSLPSIPLATLSWETRRLTTSK